MATKDGWQQITGDMWPNLETRVVQLYLANKTAVMLHMREAAREFFHSPYRKWNEGELLACGANAEGFAEYVRRYVEFVTRPQRDPGHDAEGTLHMKLVQLSLSRVDWDAIAKWWHAVVSAECEIHCSQL